MRDYVIAADNLTEEERMVRQNYMTDQLMNNGLTAMAGVGIADNAA